MLKHMLMGTRTSTARFLLHRLLSVCMVEDSEPRTHRNRLLISLFLFCLLGATNAVYATDVLQNWVAFYNSPGNLEDWASDLEVDGSKNVYVAGTSGVDVVVLKYNSGGSLEWQRSIGTEVYPWSRSYLELDGVGNIYVAYTEVDEGTFPCDPRECINVVTRKYDPSGILQWESKFGPKVDGNVSDLEVDNAGNVYVARHWNGIIKYDTNGTELWWAGAPDILDLELGISGNILLTGRASAGPGQTSLYASIFSPEGNLIAYKSSLDQLDINGGTAVTTDSEGAIYIAGISIMGGDNVVKFERDLNCPPTLDYCYLEVDWTTHFGTTVMWEQPNSIELDIDGNIYVSGSSRLTDTSFYDCLVTKYDPSGNKLWESRYDADGYEDLHIDMEMDDYANVYLACRSVVGGPLQRDYVAIKYDSNGSEVWAKRYDGPVNGADYITDIELDGDDDVYVTGQASSIEGLDFATVKYIEATTENAIASLLLAIESMEFSHGIDNSLKTKIKKLPKMVSSGNRKAASNVTQAFIHQVEGIQGTKLTNKQANELITHVQELLLTME